MGTELCDKIREKFDRKSERKIALEWAKSLIPGGNIEKYSLFHAYTDRQPEIRKKSIIRKFNYFTRVLGE